MSTSFNLFPEDYVPDTHFRLKLKYNESSNPKAPTLVGYISVAEKELSDLLEYVRQEPSKSVTMRVAVWDNADGSEYPISGKIDFKPDGSAVVPLANETRTPPSPWF